MFSIHIGLPGIVPDLVHAIDRANLHPSREPTYVVGKKMYRQHLRSFVNARPTDILEGNDNRIRAESFTKFLATLGNVAISQHAFLGSQKDLFLKKNMIRTVKRRATNLREIFHDLPVTIHMTITSHFDFLCQTLAVSEIKGINAVLANCVPSWADIVQAFVSDDPNVQIVVWDFERPENVAYDFAISMLNLKEEYQVIAVRRHVEKAIRKMHAEVARVTQEVPEESLLKLDLQYASDLQRISQMRNTVLVRSSTASDGFVAQIGC